VGTLEEENVKIEKIDGTNFWLFEDVDWKYMYEKKLYQSLSRNKVRA